MKDRAWLLGVVGAFGGPILTSIVVLVSQQILYSILGSMFSMFFGIVGATFAEEMNSSFGRFWGIFAIVFPSIINLSVLIVVAILTATGYLEW